MSYYWETHKKFFDGNRLIWHGNAPTEEFWADYWQKAAPDELLDTLETEKIKRTVLGRCLVDELNGSDQILEAGCGVGNWVVFLRRHGFKNVQGIDNSEEVVRYINQINPQLNIKWGDALNIQASNNSFDVYLSFGVVEHLLPGPEPFLNEAYRILKPFGKAIFTVPCVGPFRKIKGIFGKYHDNVEGIPFFQYGFQKLEFCTLLQTSGFKIQRWNYIEIDRLLLEEIQLYRTLAKYNTIRMLEKRFSQLFEKMDGHMLLVVCTKSGS